MTPTSITKHYEKLRKDSTHILVLLRQGVTGTGHLDLVFGSRLVPFFQNWEGKLENWGNWERD